MTGTTTGQTALPTATDSDDNEVYLTVNLVAALQALANLFESATGHDHSGAGKGKPIVTAGIGSGVTLTSPHFTTPVVDSGGLTVTAGGETITAGGLTVTAGNVGINTAQIASMALIARGTTNDTTAGAFQAQQLNGAYIISARNDGGLTLANAGGSLAFFNATLTTKLSVTGSRGANAALASLLTQLAAYGLITDSSTV